MTTTLSEGVKVPDVGSVNWAGDLEVNWNLLNGALANLSGNVKTDRDNTWTGEQSFTLPIVGSITGTASKAIADEDGNNIKSSYGKLGNLNTWATTQVFLSTLRFSNASYVSGTPSENIFYSVLQWGGYVNNTWSAPFTINNAIRTNGYSDTSFRTYSQTSNTLTGFVHETNADASDISFRPIANGTHKLGSSSYQWSSVYAQSYYYNGTAWGLDKYNRWSVAQFYSQNSIHVRNVEPGVAPSSDVSAGIRFEDANASYVFADIVGKVFTGGTTFINLVASNKFTNGALDPNGTTISKNFQIGLRADGSGFMYTDCGWRNSLVPYSADSGGLNLGTSTNKWKTLNGINPGALSLPSSTSIAIDTTNWNKTGADNSYTPLIDGWLLLRLNNVVGNYLFIANPVYSLYSNATGTGSSWFDCFMPVRANVALTIQVKGTNLVVARLYPCLGNV